MTRKYIDDLGINYENTPQGWCSSDEIEEPWRQERKECWKKEREVYGFDARETWGLDGTFKLWLYERLMMFDEVNCVDTSCHKYTYRGIELTFQDCIDRMLEGLKLDLQSEDLFNKDADTQAKINDVVPIFALCFKSLWW